MKLPYLQIFALLKMHVIYKQIIISKLNIKEVRKRSAKDQ